MNAVQRFLLQVLSLVSNWFAAPVKPIRYMQAFDTGVPIGSPLGVLHHTYKQVPITELMNSLPKKFVEHGIQADAFRLLGIERAEDGKSGVIIVQPYQLTKWAPGKTEDVEVTFHNGRLLSQ